MPFIIIGFIIVGGLLLTGCSSKNESAEPIVVDSKPSSGSPPPDPDPPKPVNPYGNLQNSPEEPEPVVKGARLACTGCPGETEERRIRLPESEIKSRETLYASGNSGEGSFPTYATLKAPMMTILPIALYNNTADRMAKAGKLFMNHKDNRPDINIPRFTNCLFSGDAASSGEGWQAGDGVCPMSIPVDTYWEDVK